MLRQPASRFCADRRGATAIEYAVIAAFLSTAIIGGLNHYTSSVGDMYDSIAEAMVKK